MRRRITAWLLAALIAVAACPAVLATDGEDTNKFNIAKEVGEEDYQPELLKH